MLRPLPLPDVLATTAFAFRGYNVANLGRTPELLDHPVFGPTVRDALREGSAICAAATGRPCDLVARVQQHRETRDLSTYAEDVALIVCVSVAQIRLLAQHFKAPLPSARLAFGYSLGEASALIASETFELKHLLRVPLALADDSVALADGVTMGVLFSRGPGLDLDAVQRLCVEINQLGVGTIGISSILTPNAALLLGQGATIDHFQARLGERVEGAVSLRRNPNRWPPLHTPITWQRAIPNRAAVMLQAIPGGMTGPPLPILSGVTGRASYTEVNSRDLLHRWVDHPQRLWDQIAFVLGSGVRTVVHVGPAPNLIPATFKRLAEAVRHQMEGRSPMSLGRRMMAGFAARPWLASLLPSAASLLRAPSLRHVHLEDWLLENA